MIGPTLELVMCDSAGDMVRCDALVIYFVYYADCHSAFTPFSTVRS